MSVVNGHMLMKTPIPYGRGVINNSPLDASGSDFPCKNVFTMTDPVADVNHMAIGEPQTLSFTGSAVHGGGSCQVSLTTDLTPTKNSKWMVIKSIEGGCPADVAGNLATDPSGSGASTFQYTVPAGISPGQYTIAWTWVNKVGNREFYMNCGRADITAAKKKRYAPAPKPGMSKRATSFPDLFVANIAGVSNGCTTVENFDTTFPNPGADVQKSSDGHFGPPSGCTGSAASNPAEQPSAAAGGSSASSSAAPAASSVAASSVVASYTATSAPQVTGGSIPGIFASGAAPQSSAAATSAPAVAASNSPAVVASSSPAAVAPVASTATVVPVPAASSTPSSSSSGSASSQAQGTKCSSEGDWLCATDGKSFQRCASGAWSASISMAAGMSCTPGQSATIAMKATGSHKRSLLAKHGSIHHRRALPVIQS